MLLRPSGRTNALYAERVTPKRPRPQGACFTHANLDEADLGARPRGGGAELEGTRVVVALAKVAKLALKLEGVSDASKPGYLAFSFAGEAIAWTYMRRLTAKAKRLAELGVLAVRCPIERKEMLIEAAPSIYFDDNHYRGFPAVLVRLQAIKAAELSALLKSACVEPPSKRARRTKRL